MAKVAKLEREPLTKRAVQAIRSAIMAGEYQPGGRLVEEVLAASLGVSRNVVREAFWQLEAQGLIHNDDYRGKSLTVVSHADLVELIPMRVALESLVATLAARRITPEDAAALRAQAALFKQGVTTFAAYGEIDFKLHQMIWQCAGSRHIELVLNRVAGPMIALKARVENLDLEALIRKEVEERDYSHVCVVEKICAGDAAGARLAMQRHVLAFWYMWLQHVTATGSGSAESQKLVHKALNTVARWNSSLDFVGVTKEQ